MSILIVTDAWRPQVNGVVLTLERLAATLEGMGAKTNFIAPSDFRTIPMPTYPEIRLSLATSAMVKQRIDELRPDRIHIATEGPLGVLARKICIAQGWAFTTSYHTRFPEFIRARVPFPERWSYRWLRNFHNAGKGILVATPSMGAELAARGFRNIRLWSRGVDTQLFHPSRREEMDLLRPIFLNVGRVAVEKNLSAFLDLKLPGSKIVVGDGPDLQSLKAKYPDVHFTGTRRGEDLAKIYASADVFVFPSKTDTFGNVILEALASGCPVAGFPVTGPLDIIGDGHGGALSIDLREAALASLNVPRDAARKHAMSYDWQECARQFLDYSTAINDHSATV